MNDPLTWSVLVKYITKPPDEHPEFCRLMRAVASGKMTVDEAWKEWQDYQSQEEESQ